MRRITHPALPIDPFLLSLDDTYCRCVYLKATAGIEPGKHLPRFDGRQEAEYQLWIAELFEVAAEDGWETINDPADFAPEERSTVVVADADAAFATVPATDHEYAAHVLATTFDSRAWLVAGAMGA